MNSFPLSRRAVGAGLLASLATPALAQRGFPDRPLRLVVPFPPGGGTDTIARLVAERMTSSLGQPVVVENRPGGSGIIGARAVQTAPADGHTIMLASNAFIASAVLADPPGYDPLSGFAPLALLGNSPNVLVVGGKAHTPDLKSLLARAKESREGLNYASYGDLSAPHLAAIALQRTTGTRMVHIPYRGGGPATTAVVAGEVDLLLSSLLPVLPLVRDGELRALAVAGERRIRPLPEVPTFREAGVDFRSGTWFGLVATPGTPAPAITRLSEAAIAAIRTPAIAERLEHEGTEVIGAGPQPFTDFLKDEVKRHEVLRPAVQEARGTE